MGNGQSTFTPPARVMPSDAELDAFMRETKSKVKEEIEPASDRYKRYIDAMTPKIQQIKKATESFVDELAIGLTCHKAHPLDFIPSECSFKMCDAMIPKAPTGHEKGVVYALDFGGTNFRVLRVELKDGRIRESSKKASLMEAEVNLPKGVLDPKATASQMFDFFAKTAEDFMRENGDINSNTPFNLGYTHSYPCMLRRLDSAIHMVWTKGFETGRDTDDPVEGTDVAELMNMACRRRNLPLRVNCVANDTVGTLLSCAYSLDTSMHPPCAVGLILGTGMNAAYIEDRALDYGFVGKIINIECGNFNRDLPFTNIDYENDFADVGGRGRQHLEKMVSGAYLGELCRRTLVKIFQFKATPNMWQPNSFTTADAATVVGDKSSNLIVVERKCLERWNASFDHEELSWIRDVCVTIFERAAALSAMLIAGCAIKSGRLQEALGGLTVGIDGSLYKCNLFFAEAIKHWLILILGERQARLVHLVHAEDGSGLGAAILAALAT